MNSSGLGHQHTSSTRPPFPVGGAPKALNFLTDINYIPTALCRVLQYLSG